MERAAQRWVSALTFATALMTAMTASPAHAVTTSPWFGHAQVCGSGEITSASAVDGTVVLEGWVRPCSAPRSGDYFAVGEYFRYSDGLVGTAPAVLPVGQIRTPMRYAPGSSPVATTAFRVHEIPGARTSAYCLASYYTTRLACVRVDRIGDSLAFAPITTQDRQVSFPIGGDVLESSALPKCATCW